MTHDHDHDHGHDHGHTHSHDPEMSLEQKLITLLTHWVNHNDSHKENYLSWALKAEKAGLKDVAVCLDQAGTLSRQVTQKLEEALKKLS